MARRDIMLEQQPEDFDALPPALRRKLFSNLERFRLEQIRLAQTHARNSQSVAYHDPRQPEFTNNSAATSPRRRQPKNSQYASPQTNGLNRRFRAHKPQKQRIRFPCSRKSKTLQTAYLAAQANFQWFHSLPPKLQLQQFSVEERACFDSWQSSVILDAADEALYKLGHKARSSSDSINTVPVLSGTSSSSKSSTLSDPLHEADSAIEMDDGMYDSFRWLDDDEDLDLKLDYHSHIAPSRPLHLQRFRRPSFRRTFSFSSSQKNRSSVIGMPPKSSHSVSVTPSSPCLSPRKHRSSLSRCQPVLSHESKSSITSIDHPAQYYQDPEARLKLRVYLASPQKFDEAIEFGFPSLELNEGFNSRLSIDREWKIHDDPRTFLDNDSKSVLNEPLSQPEKRTKKPSSRDHFSSPTISSTASSGLESPRESSRQANRPRLVPIAVNDSQNIIGNREMTLKMTLTRPDLRRAESSLVSPRASEHDDPLRLADLPAPDEELHLWNSQPESTGKMKRFLQKLGMRRH